VADFYKLHRTDDADTVFTGFVLLTRLIFTVHFVDEADIYQFHVFDEAEM
jgi:hypothetical protein